jgi:hypothetical protein
VVLKAGKSNGKQSYESQFQTTRALFEMLVPLCQGARQYISGGHNPNTVNDYGAVSYWAVVLLTVSKKAHNKLKL